MISPEHVGKIFERNQWVIERQSEGVTHEESLLQPSFRANCMNWVLGHLVYERQRILEVLGKPRTISETITDRYARESDPITEELGGELHLDEILRSLNESEQQIRETLATIAMEDWTATMQGKDKKLWEWIEFLAWHESYHLGQLEILRQLAGKNDKVI